MTIPPLDPNLFTGALPLSVANEIARQNPWWTGRSAQMLPTFRRWPYETILKRILREPPLAKIIVLKGPRQIGKSTLQGQLIQELLGRGIEPQRILRLQFDDLPSLRGTLSDRADPILGVTRWFEDRILKADLNQAAREGRKAYFFLDEVQNLRDWAIQLKSLVDITDVVVVVTGSSALRIELGRDSLAGRMQTLEIGPFRLPEIASFRGLGDLPAFDGHGGNGTLAKPEFWTELSAHGKRYATARDRAFSLYSERGGYPVALQPDVPWAEAASQLNELVVKRVITHDLRIGERGKRRDEQLLQEVFRMASRYAGQAPSVKQLAKQINEVLQGNVGDQRVRKYLDFLDSSLLIRLIRPLEMRLKKQSGAPKICVADHAVRAAWLDEVIPLDSGALDANPLLADMAGRIAESCAGAFLASLLDQSVNHLPDRNGQGEIDFVVAAGAYRVPIEIKFRAKINPQRDTRNLSEFIAKEANNAPLGVLISRDEVTSELPTGIVSVPLRTLLLMQ